MITFTEMDIEAVALEWLANLRWRTAHDLDIASDTANAKRNECRHFGEWLALVGRTSSAA